MKKTGSIDAKPGPFLTNLKPRSEAQGIRADDPRSCLSHFPRDNKSRSAKTALQISVAATGMALLCFGAVKGHFTGVNKIKSALQTLLVGGLAAGAAYWLAHLFG